MKRIIPFLLALFVFSACNEGNSYATESVYDPYEGSYSEELAEDKTVDIQRKIIKTGNISFESKNVKETKNSIHQQVKEFNGYISNDVANKYERKTQYHITVRIPAESFDDFLSQLEKGIDKVDSKNINSTDVTEEYIDVETRINTKKELENRFKELLAQATSVDEILSIEREIGQLRTEIESAEGRLKSLSNKLAFSTLEISFYEKTSVPFQFLQKVSDGIKNGWTNLLWFFVALINIWPFIIAGIVFAVVWRARKKRLKKT